MPDDMLFAEHLGDGAYVAWDGYHVWLSANADPSHTYHRVGLEPRALEALERWLLATLEVRRGMPPDPVGA